MNKNMVFSITLSVMLLLGASFFNNLNINFNAPLGQPGYYSYVATKTISSLNDTITFEGNLPIYPYIIFRSNYTRNYYAGMVLQNIFNIQYPIITQVLGNRNLQININITTLTTTAKSLNNSMSIVGTNVYYEGHNTSILSNELSKMAYSDGLGTTLWNMIDHPSTSSTPQINDYSLTFSESGIDPTSWGVSLYSSNTLISTQTTSSNSITFTEPKGSYTYKYINATVNSYQKYEPSTPTGSISLSSNSIVSENYNLYNQVKIESSGNGNINYNSQSSNIITDWVENGNGISFSGNPNSNYEFRSWSCSQPTGLTCPSISSSSSQTLIINKPLIITGQFSLIPGLSISISPSTTQTLNSGQILSTFTASVNGGVSPYTIDWYESSSDSYSGTEVGTGTQYTVNTANTEYYYAVVTDSNSNTVKSNIVEEVVNQITPIVTQTPTVSSYQTPIIDYYQITLGASFSGETSPYTIQWYSGTSSCTNPISNSNSISITQNPTSSTEYCYSVTDSATSTTSSPLSVSVLTPTSTEGSPFCICSGWQGEGYYNAPAHGNAESPYESNPTVLQSWIVTITGSSSQIVYSQTGIS